MKFNNVIDTLRCWCQDMTTRYFAEYQEECHYVGSSQRFLRYLVTSELKYKLEMLVDRDFKDFQHFLHTVKQQIPIHLDPVLSRPLSEEKSSHIKTAETGFLKYLMGVSPHCPQPEIPYVRNIVGEEAESIISLYRSVWKYQPEKYWYPMNGGLEEDKLYIMDDCLENYMDKICQLVGIPEQHIYVHGESRYPDVPNCSEVDELIGYGGCEVAYTDNNFRWLIYFSHEGTVTFAGSIVPQVKDILRNEVSHWNRWE